MSLVLPHPAEKRAFQHHAPVRAAGFGLTESSPTRASRPELRLLAWPADACPPILGPTKAVPLRLAPSRPDGNTAPPSVEACRSSCSRGRWPAHGANGIGRQQGDNSLVCGIIKRIMQCSHFNCAASTSTEGTLFPQHRLGLRIAISLPAPWMGGPVAWRGFDTVVPTVVMQWCQTRRGLTPP